MLTVTPVAPVGTREATGFAMEVSGECKPLSWSEKVYPKSPEGRSIRDLRVSMEVSLRHAAQLLGLSAVDLAAVETGRARLSDYDEARRLLVEFSEAPEDG